MSDAWRGFISVLKWMVDVAILVATVSAVAVFISGCEPVGSRTRWVPTDVEIDPPRGCVDLRARGGEC